MTHPPTPPPNHDRDLVTFLHQHRPQPPAAAPGLEDQILSAIEQPDTVQPLRQRRWYRSAWLPTAIAASLVAGLVSYRALSPSESNPNDLRALETFIESSWETSVNEETEDDWSVLRSQGTSVRMVAAPSSLSHSPLPDYRR